MTIKPNYHDPSRGVSITHEPYACLTAWEKRGKVRNSDDAVYLARIISTMAGAEAEAELLGLQTIGDDADREQIELMAGELSGKYSWSRLEPRLRKMTRMLVRRHRVRIERVAEALLVKRKLTAKQVDKLAGRSVDDVKVNAPFLLATHHAGRFQLSAAKKRPVSRLLSTVGLPSEISQTSTAEWAMVSKD